MDILTRKALQELIESTSGSHISMFMPTHPAGRGKEQDPIRLKNCIKKAQDHLQGRGVETGQIDRLLQPVHALWRDPFFWDHQSSGLAIFSAMDKFSFYRLPLPFEEMVTVSNRFYLKPILPYFANDGHFYVLALSQKQIRLLEGTRHTVEEIDLGKTQPGLAEALRPDQFFDTVQAHTGRKSSFSREHLVMFHGHEPGDEEKKRILGWFHSINEQLNAFLSDQHSPLVLAGVESGVRLFREACAYPHITEQALSGNPDDMRPDELHQQAWPLVQPTFRREQENAVSRYHSLSGTDQAADDVRKIVPAARHGRVDILFVTTGEKMSGKVDPQTHAIHIHRDPQPGDEDLLDLALVETLTHGGDVHVLDQAEMPYNALIAAIFRY